MATAFKRNIVEIAMSSAGYSDGDGNGIVSDAILVRTDDGRLFYCSDAFHLARDGKGWRELPPLPEPQLEPSRAD